MFVAGMLCGCGGSDSPKLITPLPSGIDVNDLGDCTLPASFTVNDFNWRGSNLSFEAFSEDLYDAVEIHNMKAGDTLVYEGNKIVVEQLIQDGDYLTVNCDVDEGGAWLQANEGGTYRAYTFSDHSLYSKIGDATVILADDFRIIDCGDEPTDPYDTVATDQKLYLETLENKSFYPVNTEVTIKDGKLIEIVRRWIP